MKIVRKHRFGRILMLLTCLIFVLSACGTAQSAKQPAQSASASPTGGSAPTPKATSSSVAAQRPPSLIPHMLLPTPTLAPLPSSTPAKTVPAPLPRIQPIPNSSNRPVLAFYYPWYNSSTWDGTKMSDLPTIRYNSSDDATIERQLTWAASAGITGFISSWWGAGDQTDKNFASLLTHATGLEQRTGYRFASSIYFESDAPALQGSAKTVSALNYLLKQYGNDTHFFHWQGKPVIFFWSPLGNGRTLAYWEGIRQQVDPTHQMIWSAEGVSMDLLSVFDGIHLFSAGYWGIQHNTMPQVDQGFRQQISSYNQAHGTQKIWAAGVLPGYDDTRVPGRQGAYSVPRNNGTTYTTSWNAAMSSSPEWITITSFNEWFEGAQIEPSVNYDTQYLNLTQQFAKKWHG